jgi:hypothetical protein
MRSPRKSSVQAAQITERQVPPIAAPTLGGDVATSGSRVMLLLDDGCGYVGSGVRGCDDDHDDMWVRVTHAVPTPAAVLLFGAGLLGLGLVRRRATQA